MFTITLPSLIKSGWESSKLATLPNQTPQFKGSLGTKIVHQLIPGSVIISNEGDLQIGTEKSEVKTALFNTKTKCLWWNQIRPKQSGWTKLHLVAIYPDKISVYEFTRDQAEKMFQDPVLSKSGHVGTKELLEVKCVINSKRNTLTKLTEYGDCICNQTLDNVKVENE